MIAVRVERSHVELVSDRFWQLGVRAVSEVDVADDVVDVVSSVGNDQDAIDRAVASFEPGWEWRVEQVSTAPSQDWREHARPVRYGDDMLMVPAWIPDHHEVRPEDHVTFVEPGSAFGLGDHPTTMGSMQLLAELLRGPQPIGSVLDVGCGTGVLAILAAQHDVTRVRAIDVADAAVSATRHNAVLNGVDGLVEVDTAPLTDLDERFDVVVANILAPVLISLAPDLVRSVAPGGALVISGILAARHQHVLDALEPMTLDASVTIEGWITIRLRHH